LQYDCSVCIIRSAGMQCWLSCTTSTSVLKDCPASWPASRGRFSLAESWQSHCCTSHPCVRHASASPIRLLALRSCR
jgi:hypothetical protein